MLISDVKVEVTGVSSFTSKKGNEIKRLIVLDDSGRTIEFVYFGDEKLEDVYIGRGFYYLDLNLRNNFRGLSCSVEGVRVAE